VSERLRIIVLGMMGRCPFAGQTWLYLNWLRGLDRLGHEVWYVEDDSVWPYDPELDSVTDECAYAVRHISNCLERIGLSDRWAFRFRGRDGACWGLSEARLRRLYRSSDVVLNVVGATDLGEDHLSAPFRVYVQTDPVTAELRLANGDQHTRLAFESHDVVVTYGENYGATDCRVPLNGMRYGKTRQPVDLGLWPMAFDHHSQPFTTIGNYRQRGSDVSYDGELYRWSKHHEWERLIDLPTRTSQPFELAMLPDDPADRERLRTHGWRLRSPFPMSLDVFGAYPKFIRGSRGELTVAKDQNVRLRSGWFSERDACYLASGKPVIAQDTGFGAALPTGEGLFAFSDTDDALAAIEAVNSDYRRHCEAAREIAQQHFEARAVAERLLTTVDGLRTSAALV
jgi:hypothetical protein